MDTKSEMTTALLHDVIEGSDYTSEDLLRASLQTHFFRDCCVGSVLPALNLETAVGSRKYAQVIDAPSKCYIRLTTNKVATRM
jgi:hypothetical protein